MPDVTATVPPVVLAVYAHPDDPEVACGGTLAQWSSSGAAVHLLIACTGDKGAADAMTDTAGLVDARAGRDLGGAGPHRLRDARLARR